MDGNLKHLIKGEDEMDTDVIRNVIVGVIKRGDEVLLVKEFRKTHWKFPGGHLEEGETYIECLDREIGIEELPGLHIHRIFFLMKFDSEGETKKHRIRIWVYVLYVSGTFTFPNPKFPKEVIQAEFVSVFTRRRLAKGAEQIMERLRSEYPPKPTKKPKTTKKTPAKASFLFFRKSCF